MNIIGLDYLVFEVDDFAACRQMALDYGLTEEASDKDGSTFVALDGTGLIVKKHNAPGLPEAIAPAPNIREVIYGVADQETLEAIEKELKKDRQVTKEGNVLHSVDDEGYPIGFQVSIRKELNLPHYGVNVPGQEPGRPANNVAADLEQVALPLSLSHVVLFTQDKQKAEDFYSNRLGFRTVDVFTNVGPFMRPAGTDEHHTLFLIHAPKLGVQHFTFHFAGANEILKGGFDLVEKGYNSVWGPGRHVLGSNYFWYFNSPFGGLLELDADMDKHDDDWEPRFMDANEESSQTFLLKYTEKWSPRGKH